MTTLTATDARKGFFELLKSARELHEVYHIRYRGGDAVLMSQDEYDSILETMDLLSAPGFRGGIRSISSRGGERVDGIF